MEKQIEEMRDTLANINGTNGIHILGYYPLAEELVKQGYRKVKQGEWKVRGLPTRLRRLCEITHEVTCTKCGFDTEMLQGIRYRYCPHCGAKMRGE